MARAKNNLAAPLKYKFPHPTDLLKDILSGEEQSAAGALKLYLKRKSYYDSELKKYLPAGMGSYSHFPIEKQNIIRGLSKLVSFYSTLVQSEQIEMTGMGNPDIIDSAPLYSLIGYAEYYGRVVKPVV